MIPCSLATLSSVKYGVVTKRSSVRRFSSDVIGTGEMMAGQIRRRKGIGGRPQGGQRLKGVAFRASQTICVPERRPLPRASGASARRCRNSLVHAPVMRSKKGEGLGVARLWQNVDCKAVDQKSRNDTVHPDGRTQAPSSSASPSDAAAPDRRWTLSSCSSMAAAAAIPSVTSSTWAMSCSRSKAFAPAPVPSADTPPYAPAHPGKNANR